MFKIKLIPNKSHDVQDLIANSTALLPIYWPIVYASLTTTQVTQVNNCLQIASNKQSFSN